MSPASTMASFLSIYVEFQGAGGILNGNVVFFGNACCFSCFFSLPNLKMKICSFEIAGFGKER